MPRYFVMGGRQRPSHLLTRDEWFAYEKAVLIELDTDTGRSRTVLEYTSPPGRRPARSPSHVFKAGSWDGRHLLLCTQTEVVVFDPAREQVVETISHPWMNDVHHVTRIGGRLHVVSTGLDAVLVIDEQGAVAALHSAITDPTWLRHDEATDYRLVPTTKPHAAHPNYVFEADGQVWITRFEQRDAICLADRERRVPLADDPVHDGVHDGHHTWFTVVSGQVVQVDTRAGSVVQRFDLTGMDWDKGRPMGWCRGIHREADRTLLAFSRLRPTTLKQNLAWLRKPLGKAPEAAPTRVAAYDLEAGRLLQTWPLEDAGISSIFSVLPATPPA